jgi:glycosyltransferase involved in cell wall biosynthesis
MTRPHPRVSIGLPVYNGERFIRDTLDSIRAQTFQDWELIISDNASTDGTAEICREYAARDPRIRHERNLRNIGGTRNFNRTIELASAPYFKSANADDLCEPDLVARCVETLDQHPEVVLCYGRTVLIDEDGRQLRDFDDRLDLRAPRATDRFWLAAERIRLVNVLQGVMRTDAVRRAGGLRSFVGSDVVLVLILTLYGHFHELPDQLFYRRLHPGAFSSLKSMESRLKFVDPAADRKVYFHTWRNALEYHRGILRAPLSPAEKIRLTLGLLRSSVGARHDFLSDLAAGLTAMLRR